MSSKSASHKITIEILGAISNNGGFLLRKTLDLIIKNQKKKYYAIRYLDRKELIAIGEKNGESIISITKSGQKKLLMSSLGDMKIKRPKIWDGRWRVVIFDIPEKRKGTRRSFKKQLDYLGFFALQKSIYAHPFDCEEEIAYIRDVYEIRPYVQIITAEGIENETKLKRKYGV